MAMRRAFLLGWSAAWVSEVAVFFDGIMAYRVGLDGLAIDRQLDVASDDRYLDGLAPVRMPGLIGGPGE